MARKKPPGPPAAAGPIDIIALANDALDAVRGLTRYAIVGPDGNPWLTGYNEAIGAAEEALVEVFVRHGLKAEQVPDEEG